MPFTVSHAAAALPFRRRPLILSALVIGTFAPDIEYFLRLEPGGGWGHTIPGAFGLSLPLGLITLWLFHGYVKLPAAMLLPAALQQRMEPGLHPFRFAGIRRFATIVLSLLIGIATHILWDGFTHVHSWMFDHSEFLRKVLHLPLLGWIPVASLLQYISSIAGLIILAAWFRHWYRTGQPHPEPVLRTLSPGQKAAIVGMMSAIALIGAALRVILGTGIPPHFEMIRGPFGQAVVTFIAIVWWELIAWGFRLRPRFPHRAPGKGAARLHRESRDVA